MFNHAHPYEPFLFPEATKMIVGTLPPPRFTIGALKHGDVNFCYGSKDGQLWPILDRIFSLSLHYETTQSAIEERMAFLRKRKIGICDIVASAQRTKVDASDLGMKDIRLRNILNYLHHFPNIHTLLFTGGNSLNGPEYLFRKQLKEHGISLRCISDEVPRIHQFSLKSSTREIRTVSLTAPSGAANRAIGSMDSYKELKNENPTFTTFDFRVLQYKPFF
ncbi:uracil-DNA glycosylase family protein [Muriicola sp.]|uniref:uracil-DNA glycosylase family protein n=1 Tax=Muriicola sp. TaxID=2020856 RepID=UPI003C729EBB